MDTIIPELANPLVVDDPFAYEYTYKPAQTKILVRHLLNHSSGLHYYPAHRKASPYDLGRAYNGVSYDGDHSPAKFFELIRVRLVLLSVFCSVTILIYENRMASLVYLSRSSLEAAVCYCRSSSPIMPY